MANPFVAEIRMFGGNFAPRGWALCNGQIMAISQNTALFSLLGTTYGGDGKSNFALPNLQGCAPMHWGQGPGLTDRVLGEAGGETTVTLTAQQIPSHPHTYNCGAGSKGETDTVTNQVNCDEQTGTQQIYATSTDGTLMNANMLQSQGNLPHLNQQPFLCVTFIIALQGVFPPRS